MSNPLDLSTQELEASLLIKTMPKPLDLKPKHWKHPYKLTTWMEPKINEEPSGITSMLIVFWSPVATTRKEPDWTAEKCWTGETLKSSEIAKIYKPQPNYKI